MEATLSFKTKSFSTELRTEFLRKSIHIMIALVPSLASVNLGFTFALLGSGSLVYAYAEMLRLQGQEVFLITRITNSASRERDRGQFVLGPVTLALGTMIALLLYPEPAAALGIYALAFGDGFASLVGKLFPLGRMTFLEGKTFSGSFACFLAVFLVSLGITGDTGMAFLLAITATFLEGVSARDLDNIVIPVGTGLAATLMMGLTPLF